ncbi:MAG: DUF2064 domain-containing protein, partial [Pseudomonadota bacterium]
MPNQRRPTLVLMARWPMLGQGKSRLAADTSAANAVRVQRHSLDRLVTRLGHQPGFRPVIAFANTADLRRAKKHRRFAGLCQVAQTPGDLGQRMRQLLISYGQRLRPVLIIGSDLPSIRPADLSSALKLLRSHDVVLGPAADGGFWLIGWRGGPAQAMPSLAGITWSTASTRAETIKRLSNSRSRRRRGSATVGLL